VRNGIVLDATAFDEERWNPAWGPTVARAYHAPVAGLSANYGSFTVEARPALKEGDPLRVSLDPPVGHFTLVNQGRTAGQRSRPSLQVTRQAFERGERVVVSGTLGVGASPQVVHRSVIDPVRYAGTVLRMQLEANGVEIAGPTEIGTVPETARLLLEYEGKSLGEIVRLCMKYSNNAIAESLVKAMGAQASGGAGSWRDGIAAMHRKLQTLGMEMSSSTLVDGSGLSRDNRISARTLVQALRIARSSFAFGSELIGALPIAARDGTLEKRADGAAGRVRAKTGLLNGAAGLSGFAQLADGSEAIFSVLLNGYRVDDGTAMAILDEFASTLVQSTLKDFQPRERANRRDGRAGP
jgi:D-alanyl-D-alanine carboxypeptidase/D-alanyl-D-alanine-endopeptidase (penicillin-binding protein 4)